MNPASSKLLVWMALSLILAIVSGGSAVAIALHELSELIAAHAHIDVLNRIVETEITLSLAAMILLLLSGLVGSLALSGSLIAGAKQQGWLKEVIRFPAQRPLKILALLAILILGGLMLYQTEMIPGTTTIVSGNFPIGILQAFFILALIFGAMMTASIGKDGLPGIILLFNALAGVALGFEGFVMGNVVMMIAGAVVAPAGFLLTLLIAKAMNQSLDNLLFPNQG